MQATLDLVVRNTRDKTRILACLKEHGICVVPEYCSQDFAETLRRECQERLSVPGDADFEDGSYKRFDTYAGTASGMNERIYHLDCFSKNGELFRHDPFLAGIASDYYGFPESVHVLVYERHRYNEIPVRSYHIDTFELSTFKVMLYLTDVEEKDGPTSYVVGTHVMEELRYKKEHVWGPALSPGDPSGKPHPTNFTAGELGTLLEKHVHVTGPRGTVVLFDTWGVHCGLPPDRDGDRHVMVNYYRKGADLPRSDFGFDNQADYRRYAVDYKKHLEK